MLLRICATVLALSLILTPAYAKIEPSQWVKVTENIASLDALMNFCPVITTKDQVDYKKTEMFALAVLGVEKYFRIYKTTYTAELKAYSEVSKTIGTMDACVNGQILSGDFGKKFITLRTPPKN